MLQGRATWAEIAADLGVSAPAAAERVRRLETQSSITGYAAVVDPRQVGYELTAFVEITLDRPHHRRRFTTALEAFPEVVECHHIAGDYDYLLKVRCRGTADLDDLLSRRIKGLPGIARTRTTIVLATMKESVYTPIVEDPVSSR